MSFNTQLGTSGWALQGELSHRMDAPLQIDDAELFFATLTPLTADRGERTRLARPRVPFVFIVGTRSLPTASASKSTSKATSSET